MKRLIVNVICSFISATFLIGAVPATQPVPVISVVLRDTDARAATTRPVREGDYVVTSVLPSHWSLQFNFSGAPGVFRLQSTAVSRMWNTIFHGLCWAIMSLWSVAGDHRITLCG